MKTKTKTKSTTKLEKVIIKRFHATWIVRHESELSESELLFLASKNPENLRVIDRLNGLLTPQKSAAINLTFQQAQASAYQAPAPAFQAPAPAFQAPAPAFQAPAPAFQAPAPAFQAQASAYQAPAPAFQAPAPAFQAPAPAFQAPAPSFQAPAPAFQAPAFQAPAPAFQQNDDSPDITWTIDKAGKFYESYSFRPEYLLEADGGGWSELEKPGKNGKYSIFSCGDHHIYVFPTNKGRKIRIATNLESTRKLYEGLRHVWKEAHKPTQA
jgi:hypothetical protein